MDIALITGKQSAAARAMLGISQAELARRAGLSGNTVIAIETGAREVGRASLLAARAALEASGIQFVADGDKRGVMMSVPATKAAGE